jgi:tetratricopeptide (TPR) repeat protein
MSERADECFTQGLQAALSGERERAISLLDHAIDQGLTGSDRTTAHAFLCSLLFKEDRYAEAVRHGERALALDPDDSCFTDIDLRHTLFGPLDALWSTRADEISAEEGVEAARDYLLGRLNIVRLTEDYFPFIHLKISEISFKLSGQGRDALNNLRRANEHANKALRAEVPNRPESLQHPVYKKIRRSATYIADATQSILDQSSCWIASTVYGRTSTEVITLQVFRDLVLARSLYGRIFIACYYRTAPFIAARLAGSPWLSGVVARALRPVVQLVARRQSRRRALALPDAID